MLRTVDEVIDALGGDTAVGKRFRLSQSAVGNWRLRGEIPGAWHLRIFVDLKRLGFDFEPSVFGLNDQDAEALASLGIAPRSTRSQQQEGIR